MKSTLVAMAVLILVGIAAAQNSGQQQQAQLANGQHMAAMFGGAQGQNADVQQPCSTNTITAITPEVGGDVQNVSAETSGKKKTAKMRADDPRKSPWAEPRDWTYIANSAP